MHTMLWQSYLSCVSENWFGFFHLLQHIPYSALLTLLVLIWLSIVCFRCNIHISYHYLKLVPLLILLDVHYAVTSLLVMCFRELVWFFPPVATYSILCSLCLFWFGYLLYVVCFRCKIHLSNHYLKLVPLLILLDAHYAVTILFNMCCREQVWFFPPVATYSLLCPLCLFWFGYLLYVSGTTSIYLIIIWSLFHY